MVVSKKFYERGNRKQGAAHKRIRCAQIVIVREGRSVTRHAREEFGKLVWRDPKNPLNQEEYSL